MAHTNKNLNESFIRGGYGDIDHELRDHSYDSDDISVYFRDIEEKVIQHIRGADIVFGCVAWLTNFRIIDALSTPEFGASIVVQKEDFLKPDMVRYNGWKTMLYEKYNRVKCSLTRYELPEPICHMSTCSDPTIEGIRCVGNCNTDRNPSFPRMHNKFLVFAKVKQIGLFYEYQPFDSKKNEIVSIEHTKNQIFPYAVWTGSLNFSVSSTLSFENAILIKREDIAELYLKEFCQILALSESLDWSSEWMKPEWYIGT